MEPDSSSQAIATSLTLWFADQPGLSHGDVDTSLALNSLKYRPTLVIHSSSRNQTTSFNRVGMEDHGDPDTSLTLNSFGHHQGLEIHSASKNRTTSIINHVGMEVPSHDHSSPDTSLALNTFGNRPRLVIRLACKNRPSSIDGVAQSTASTRPPSSGNKRLKNSCPALTMASDDKEKTVSKRKKQFSFALSRQEIQEDFMFITGKKNLSRTRRPPKTPCSVQQQIDRVFPGPITLREA